MALQWRSSDPSTRSGHITNWACSHNAPQAMQHGSWFHESNLYRNRCICKKWSRKPWQSPFNSLIRKQSVPDPDLEIRRRRRGGGGGLGRSSRPLYKWGGGGLPRFCFRPLGPQFGLKIRGAGPPGFSPRSATDISLWQCYHPLFPRGRTLLTNRSANDER